MAVIAVKGRFTELPPPDVRFLQKLQKVAEAPRSGGSSKKWRKTDQVGEEKERREVLLKCSKKRGNFREKKK